MKNNEKKQLTFVERNLNELRKEMNIVTEEELKAKGYECVFSDKTHRMTAIKKQGKKKCDGGKIKEKFEKLQEDLMRRYNVKLSFTDSYTLRCLHFIDRDEKPKSRKGKKSEKQNDVVAAQPELIAA